MSHVDEWLTVIAAARRSRSPPRPRRGTRHRALPTVGFMADSPAHGQNLRRRSGRDAASRLLDEGSFRQAASQIARSIAQMPSVDEVTGVLERLV